MKLVTFQIKTPIGLFNRIGCLSSNFIIDLNSAYASHLHYEKSEEDIYTVADTLIPSDMIQFLHLGSISYEASRKGKEFVERGLRKGEQLLGPKSEQIIFRREDVRILAPVPRPKSIRDFMGFEKHLETALKKRGKSIPKIWYEIPIYHKGNPNTVAGPDDPILWPSYTEKLDYELELGMYIGKKGTNISKKKATEHIAGYTIFNDISARDRQMIEMEVNMGPAKGKDFNNSNIMGPCLVTSDELHSKIRNLKMTARINGEITCEGNTGDMYWTWEDMIEYCSQDETLYLGEFFGSGTVGGGCGAELDKWVKPGDTVELEIEDIGILKNKIVRKRALY
jgi:2-keto-4-pentenoate hydratase/2-oxohepta-3-ene-1,7-dioic acid hydratase in catechol pathway